MPKNYGRCLCPRCGSTIHITSTVETQTVSAIDGELISTIRLFVINDDAYRFPPSGYPPGFEHKLYPDDGHTFEFAAQEEESPEGNLRPDSVSEGVHEEKGS